MRRVKYVKLHGGDAFIPGVGGLGTTLPPTNKTLADLTMWDAGDKILVRVKGEEAGIPMANVQLFLYYPEDKKTSET